MNGSKCCMPRDVTSLRQKILRKLSKLASGRKTASGLPCKFSSLVDDENCAGRDSNPRCGAPADVPAGHLAVYVGKQCTRFVIRATYLNHPVFRKLLEEAEEEFGYDYEGGLAIPCDELLFQHILRLFSRDDLATVKPLNLEVLEKIASSNNERQCSSEAEVVFEKDSISMPMLFGTMADLRTSSSTTVRLRN